MLSPGPQKNKGAYIKMAKQVRNEYKYGEEVVEKEKSEREKRGKKKESTCGKTIY